MNPLSRRVVSEVRAGWQAEGWRIFLSDRGRWWATTTRRPAVGRSLVRSGWHMCSVADAVDADEFTELADKLRKRSGQ